jgi:hypothetical protein
MAAKGRKSQSATASLINAAGFFVAAVLVVHLVFVLFRVPEQSALAQFVVRMAAPLALFFPGLVDAHNASLQVLLDFGLAALFWILLAGVLAKIFG